MTSLPKLKIDKPRKSGKASALKQKRLSPEERKKDFIQKAAELFAEEGFGVGTRELARKLGVTQPLLYRYFPSKEDLIEAVYRSVFLDRWRPEWDALLADRSIPVRERLEKFYASYTEAIFSREWLRIYLFAGLRGLDLNRRYMEIVQDRILTRIIEEHRHQADLPPQKIPGATEMELAWLLHGGIFYYGVRKHVYGLVVLEDKTATIATAIDIFLEKLSRLSAAPEKIKSTYGENSRGQN
jgi:AcrR family transcriptional regulator